jgi:hypothetical protein
MEMGTILKNYYSRVVNKKICMKGVVQVGFYFDWAQHKYFDPSVALRTGSAQYRLGKVRVKFPCLS